MLFVSNLGLLCSDQELNEIFGSFSGFVRVRKTKQPVTTQNGTPHSCCAFVEYVVSNDLGVVFSCLLSNESKVMLMAEYILGREKCH